MKVHNFQAQREFALSNKLINNLNKIGLESNF